MGHFAEIDSNNVVLRVLTVPDDQDYRGHYYLAYDINLGGQWRQASYNTVCGVHVLGGTPYRKNFPGIGYTFDPKLDAFIAPKPFLSWVLDEQTCCWLPPIPYPNDGKSYIWDDELDNWKVN